MMEEKLFWIGILMGLYAWGTSAFRKKRKFDNPAFSAFWHGLFCFLAGFVGMLVLTVSMDNRSGAVVSAAVFTGKQLFLSLTAGGAYGLWGLWRAGRRFSGSAKTARDAYMKEDLEWAETIFSAVLLASFMMYFFVQAFKIPSGSMRMTFIEGDHLFVNKFIYGVRIPFTKTRLARLQKVKRGDVLVFRFPASNPAEIQCGGAQYGKDFIKRAMGLPGDKVEVREGTVYVNGKPLAEENYTQYLDRHRYPAPKAKISEEDYQNYWNKRMLAKLYGENIRDNFGPIIVPAGSYFVMGDNRDRSCDSRFWGPVPEHLVKGKAWFIYWPPGRITGVK
ncbi:MAG: signal peptidase I [bacterium]